MEQLCYAIDKDSRWTGGAAHRSQVASPIVVFLIAGALAGFAKGQVAEFKATASGVPSEGGFVSVIDATHIWVGLVHTTDGGRTWHALLPATALPDLVNSAPEYQPTTFVTDTMGYLRGYRSIWVTQNGGYSWSKLFDGRGGVAFQTRSAGGAGIWDNTNEVLNHYMSRDAGKTWKKCGESKRTEIAPSGAESFISREIGWAPVALFDDRQLPGRNGVARTDDGGCHWRLLSWYDDDRIARVTFADESVGWLLPADPGPMALTVDGGVHWTQIRRPTPDFNPVAGYLRDRSHGWVFGFSAAFRHDESGIYFTSDLGKTWQSIDRSDIRADKGMARDIPLSWSEGYFRKVLEQRK